MWKLMMVAAASMALGACATVPKPLLGQYAAVAPNGAAQAQGQRVRWGGSIIKTAPEADQTCIYALSRELDSSARPLRDGATGGRFVACHAGFYDPQIFAPGREITVTGTLDGSMTSKVGDYAYHYPQVNADTIYLWPRRVAHRASPYWNVSAYYNPFWAWGPRPWGIRSVIVVPIHTHHHHRSSH